MRLAILLSLLVLLPGCATQYRAETLNVVDRLGSGATCHIRSAGPNQIIGVTVKQIDGEWVLAGRLRGRASSLMTPSSRTLRVEAVASDEAIVYSYVGTAKAAAATGWPRRSRSATFRLPIPEPARFDHLHLAMVSPTRGGKTLAVPAH